MAVRKDILRKLAELLVLFGTLIAIDHLWMGGRAFDGVEPNPYWLPVLMLAMTYGTGMGLVAAAIASLLWVSAPHQWPSGMDHLGKQHYLSFLPLMWTMTALIVGEVTASRGARFDRLNQRFRDLTADWEKAANTFASLSKINRDLQVRIAAEEHVGGQAIVAASGLVQPDHHAQLEALTKLIALAVLSDDFTCYQLRGDRIVAQLRGVAAHSRPTNAPLAGWVKAMVDRPRIFHADAGHGVPALDDFGIAAIPVRDEEDGALAAILVIHASEGLKFNAAKVAELSQVAQALSRYSALLARPHSINLVNRAFAEGKVA